ncbi:hypothetical protein D3C81_736170 [compost metagenome]
MNRDCDALRSIEQIRAFPQSRVKRKLILRETLQPIPSDELQLWYPLPCRVSQCNEDSWLGSGEYGDGRQSKDLPARMPPKPLSPSRLVPIFGHLRASVLACRSSCVYEDVVRHQSVDPAEFCRCFTSCSACSRQLAGERRNVALCPSPLGRALEGQLYLQEVWPLQLRSHPLEVASFSDQSISRAPPPGTGLPVTTNRGL